MHSTTAPSGLTYHHNGSFSGAVQVAVPMGRRAGEDHGVGSIDNNERDVEVFIPFADMKHLVLAYLRSEAIGFLEQADDAALENFFIRNMG